MVRNSQDSLFCVKPVIYTFGLLSSSVISGVISFCVAFSRSSSFTLSCVPLFDSLRELNSLILLLSYWLFRKSLFLFRQSDQLFQPSFTLFRIKHPFVLPRELLISTRVAVRSWFLTLSRCLPRSWRRGCSSPGCSSRSWSFRRLASALASGLPVYFTDFSRLASTYLYVVRPLDFT